MSAKKKFEFASNIVIFLCLVVSIILIFIYSGKGEQALVANGFESFKFFTVLSNVFMGITAFISLLYTKKEAPTWLLILKYLATCTVTLTLLTVMLYLGPVYGYIILLQYANAFMHLIIPVLAIFHLILLEPKLEQYKYIYVIYSVIPMLLYGIAYMINVTANNGYGNVKYDWYFFCQWGLGIGVVAFLAMIVFAFLIGLALYFAYKKIQIKKGSE
jgi:hypothetical protein